MTSRASLRTAAVCIVLLAAFYMLSWFAIETKSITTDEPLHALGGYLRLKYADFRVNPEDPPLFAYFAMLPHPGRELNVNFKSPVWRRITEDQFQDKVFGIETFYGTAGNDADRFIGRSRAAMAILGGLLGSVIALWSWRIAGTAAAITAAAFFAFDPNFLGHAPLVKNDVPFTLVLAALMYHSWRLGMRVTVWRIGVVALLVAIALNVKFSGLIALPILAVILISRAVMKSPWPLGDRAIRSFAGRLTLAAACLAAAAVVSFIGIWACYGFRFAPTADPNLRLNINQLLRSEAINHWRAQNAKDSFVEPPVDAIASWKPSPFVRAVLWAERHRLLPHAWLVGLLYTHQSTVMRESYLLGRFSITGWWYYFPLAMLFKTPTATLVALALAIGVVIKARAISFWTAICLGMPFVIYGGLAMRSNLNLGLRHIFPVYPFLFALIGIAAAEALRRWPVHARYTLGVLACALVIESLAAFPNYIAFFNTPSGGARGGFKLLGDSNLDWGQDLKLLSQWQQSNPGLTLYLSSFGTADPGTYGIRYRNLPGGYLFGPKAQLPRKPGVIAVTATNLQAIYMPPELRRMYMNLWKFPPSDVLGGTVYLYRFPQAGLNPSDFPDSLLNNFAPAKPMPQTISHGKRNQPPPKSFEDGLQELEQILSEIESGQVGLEDSLIKYERGNFLIQHCRAVLNRAEKQIEQLSKSEEPAMADEEQSGES